ncbi:hypothetical protein BOX15_Mlig032148g3, partial [Macrostomum lignano]
VNLLSKEMSLSDAIKNSCLDSMVRLIGPYTLVTELSNDGHWHIYLSNGDSVLYADLGNNEIDDLQTRLGLTNRQGVVNLIGASLRELQQPPTTPGAPLTLQLPVAGVQISLNPPADQAAYRRRLFCLLSSRTHDLSARLDASRRDLEAARSGGGASTAVSLAKQLGAAAAGGAGGAGGRRAVRTALPGMSLLNPMQRKRPAARGVVLNHVDDDDEDDDEEEAKEKKKEDDKKDNAASKGKQRRN